MFRSLLVVLVSAIAAAVACVGERVSPPKGTGIGLWTLDRPLAAVARRLGLYVQPD